MGKAAKGLEPTVTHELSPRRANCPHCGEHMRADTQAEGVRGYCSAVRSALTDDGRPPLEASGLKLRERLSVIGASLDRAKAQGGSPSSCNGSAG